jgi:antitoxin (DNA-binding transcriptional repressor) of toxin-antitoxin stability system
MIEVSVTTAVNGFHRFLGKVERGETVRIRKHGRAFARIFQKFSRITRLMIWTGRPPVPSPSTSKN